MPRYLRKVRSNRWIQDPLPARTLSDLSTNDDSLSFYKIEDDNSNLNAVIVALAANCDQISNFGYILVPEKKMTRAKLTLRKTQGKTPLKEINENYHYDAVELKAETILGVAAVMKESGPPQEVEESDALDLLEDFLVKNTLTLEHIKDSLAKGILKRLLKRVHKTGGAL